MEKKKIFCECVRAADRPADTVRDEAGLDVMQDFLPSLDHLPPPRVPAVRGACRRQLREGRREFSVKGRTGGSPRSGRTSRTRKAGRSGSPRGARTPEANPLPFTFEGISLSSIPSSSHTPTNRSESRHDAFFPLRTRNPSGIVPGTNTKTWSQEASDEAYRDGLVARTRTRPRVLPAHAADTITSAPPFRSRARRRRKASTPATATTSHREGQREGGITVGGKKYKVGSSTTTTSRNPSGRPSSSRSSSTRTRSRSSSALRLGALGNGCADLRKYRIPMIEANGSAESIFNKGHKYTFAVLSPAKLYLKGVIDLVLTKDKNMKTVAVLGENEPFSKEVAGGGADYARGEGPDGRLPGALPDRHPGRQRAPHEHQGEEPGHRARARATCRTRSSSSSRPRTSTSRRRRWASRSGRRRRSSGRT